MYNNNMNDDMKHFPLITNSKNPTCSWLDSANWNKNIDINYGTLTGKINNITVVDLDMYKEIWKDYNNHPFIKEFGSDFINYFKTYTVKTPNGGIHLYFKYENNTKQTTCKDLAIDIRNDGGYVVGPGSCIDGKKYTVICTNKIKSMPIKLHNWLLDNIYTMTTKTFKKKNKVVKQNIESLYKYLIPYEDIENIIKKLPLKYFSNLNDWLKFTTFCKILNVSNLWDEYSKQHSSYNYDNNRKYWDSIEIGLNYSIIEFILKEVDIYNRLPYYKLKPIPIDNIKPDIIINKQKLGYDFLIPNTNMVIKSDTGTGKTTSFKHYIKSQQDKFVSIVSRTSLAQEQYKIFSEYAIDCCLYQNEPILQSSQSVIIQIDSLRRISNFDFKDKIIFMDEFNSIIEYLVTSPTISNQRVYILRLFVKLLKEAKQVICVDADISDMCFKLLNDINIQYKYYINDYQHNKGISATEIKNKKDLVKKLSNEDKFILVCDSKKEAKYMYNELIRLNPNKPIKIYTSDLSQTEKINLDAHDRVIFSPKVIYGLDSIMVRPVYCIYKGSTISPKHMVQQVNRCRNITNIYYLFLIKIVDTMKYLDFDECKNDLHTRLSCRINEFKEIANESENNMYFYLLTYCEYINDCYNTNKFLHFKNILRTRGVIDHNLFYNMPRIPEFANSKAIMKLDRENFDITDPRVKDINEYLCIPKEEIGKYKDYFINEFKLQQHFFISSYFFSEPDNDGTKYIKEFKINYIVSNNSKLLFLKNLTNTIGLKTDENNKMYITNKLSDEQYNQFAADYTIIFKNRDKKKLDFKNENILLKKIVIAYKTFFGNFFIISKRLGVPKKTFYFINNNIMNNEKELYLKRHIILPNNCYLN
jgi:hypothetical protein